MNKKGFTLIELIMVIVVIGIVAMIAIQSVTKRISDSKERAYNIQVNNIENAAKKYMLENPTEDEYHLNTLCIKLSSLQDKGYLEKGNIKNPKTNENFNTDHFVKVKYNFDNSQYDYTFTDICSPNLVIPASKTVIENNTIKINLKDDGLYELTDSYIFRGSDPNNYIKFNNVLWRIVSIDKETMMMKIVNLNTDARQVTEAGILKDLNDDFVSGTTYQGSIKDYINTNSKWNSGIVNSLDTALSLKSIEKQSNTYNTIGLLTVGDYVDASIVKNCYSTNINNCTSYLATGKNQWLLNNATDNKTWYVDTSNKLGTVLQSSTQLYYAYPCLYLKVNAVIGGGEGTSTEPYILQ